jgi:hypothetical protein
MDGKDFLSKIAVMSDKVSDQKDLAVTEEATKTAFISPFLRDILGFDTNDLNEVIPEYTADVGIKNGERVDYAIKVNGRIEILVEAKKISEPLNVHNSGQLFRYYAVSNARIGILTNGQYWEFYTDLEKQNIMDDRPFMILDLLDVDAKLINPIRKLTKTEFDIDGLITVARRMKYLTQFESIINENIDNPSDDLVKSLGHHVMDVMITRPKREELRPIVLQALKDVIADRVNDRLEGAINDVQSDVKHVIIEDNDDDDIDNNNGIVTTELELETYRVIQSICCEIVPASRITIADRKQYCNIVLDNNSHKIIVRIVSNSLENRILYPDGDDPTWNRCPYFVYKDLNDIYNHKDIILNSLRFRLGISNSNDDPSTGNGSDTDTKNGVQNADNHEDISESNIVQDDHSRQADPTTTPVINPFML